MKNFCLFFVLLLLSNNLSGQVIALNDKTKSPLVISEQLTQFTDSTAIFSLDKVQSQAFQPVDQANFRIPFSPVSYWYRCTLRSDTQAPKTWYLEWENPVVELLDFYLVKPDGTIECQHGGSLVERSARPYFGEFPYFALELQPGQEYAVYLRVTSQRGLRANVNIYDSLSLDKSRLDEASTVGFASGLVVLRLFFVLLLAIFVVRERAFRAYGFMLVLRSLGYWGLLGKLGNLFTDNPALATTINFLSYHSLPIGYVMVVRALLPSERLPAFVNHLLNVIVAATVLLGGAILIDYRWYWLLASQYVVLFSQLLIFVLYGYAIVRRLGVNWYYSAPFLLGLGSYFFLVASAVGIINVSWIFAVAYLLFVSEIFVFGLFLGKIILDYRRQRETARRESTLKEEQTVQLKELDTLKTNFFSNISHEFRTPLTMLVGPLDDLRQQLPANLLIPAMQRNVRRLRALIDQLLDLSRLEAGHLRPAIVRADLPAFLRQLLASFESLAHSRDILFNYQQNQTSLEACFDPDKFEKIVTNLLSNAFKFTPKGGRVSVQVSHTEGGGLTLQVRDSGVGIEATRLPYLFDRFYRVESTGQHIAEGAGIGLSMVQELVKVLKGEIKVESEPGRGSTFSLTLPTDCATWQNYLTDAIPAPFPAMKQPEPEIEQQRPDPDVAAEDAPLLLVIEDNPDLRDYMRSIFKKNYRVIEAADGQEGLEQAFEQIPDLIVCDVMMPRLDGFGFCKKLKTDFRTDHIPVVMITAKATLHDRLEGLKLGADDYLTKPFDREELDVRVQNLLKQRELLRQKYRQQLTDPRVQLRPKYEMPGGDQAIGVRVAADHPIRDPFLRKAVALVNERLADSSFDVDEFCQTMNVSRSQLHRKLKALTDQSTTEFVRSIRLYRAADLLGKGEDSVSEVAYKVGFESLSYFSKSFQKQMGVPPSEWGTTDDL